MKHFVQIAVLVFACVFSLWIFREHFEQVNIEAKTKEIEQQIQSMDIENEKLEAETAAMQEKIPEFQKSLATAEEQLGPAKDNYNSKIAQASSNKLVDLDKQLAACLDKLPALIEEKTELEPKIAKVKNAIEVLMTEILKLRSERDLLKIEEDRLKKELLVLIDEDETLEKINANVNMKLIKCRSK